MDTLTQSTATNILVFMVGSADHLYGKTGLGTALTVALAKNGGAFATITPTVTERAYGWYNLALTATHTNTTGFMALHITATATDPKDVQYLVVAESDAALTAQGIWEYGNRTLTYSPTNILSISSDALTFVRGDMVTYVFEDITDLATFTGSDIAYFTLKKNYQDLDSEAILQIDSDTGLLILNGQKVAVASNAKAELTVDVAAETITLEIDADISKQLPYSTSDYYYDVELVIDGGSGFDNVVTPVIGTFTLTRDVTRKIA
jgi:DNA-binding transcriptional regulator YhcF (GntR family)